MSTPVVEETAADPPQSSAPPWWQGQWARVVAAGAASGAIAIPIANGVAWLLLATVWREEPRDLGGAFAAFLLDWIAQWLACSVAGYLVLLALRVRRAGLIAVGSALALFWVTAAASVVVLLMHVVVYALMAFLIWHVESRRVARVVVAAVAGLVALPVVALVGAAMTNVLDQRAEAAQVRNLSFTTYRPQELPTGFRVLSAAAEGTGLDSMPATFGMEFIYGTNTPPDPQVFSLVEWSVSEADAAGVSFDPPTDCGRDVPLPQGKPPTRWPCTKVATMPGGAPIWLQSSHFTNDAYLMTRLGNTHVVLSFTTDPNAISTQQGIAVLQSLQPH
jgi:hypothetical protein